MEHREEKRIVAGADKAILFIHGIIGTPNHFADFVKLVPKDVSVYNILLEGHGGTVADFSKASMKKWERQVSCAVEELLRDHGQLYIAAHSMGTLLAIEQAVKHSAVKYLFLMAVPIKLLLKPQMVCNSCKVYFNKIRPEDELAIAAKACCGITHDKNIFKYLGWVPRFLELFGKIRATRKLLPQLKTTSRAYQSQKDEMVARSSAEYLQRNSVIDAVTLENSTHYHYGGTDRAYLLEEFAHLWEQ